MNSASKTSSPHPVKELVHNNLKAVAEIEESAEDLAVVHAVLKTELKAAEATEEARRAVEQTKEVQAKLEATADKLEKATKALKLHEAEKT